MIVHETPDGLRLVTQPDHATLAGDIAAAMPGEPGLRGPNRDLLLAAVREHDNGWLETDAAPRVDPGTERPFDFVTEPARLKQEVWTRGIQRAAGRHPRVGALVAEHALTVSADRRNEPDWRAFFTTITALRDELLRQLGLERGPDRERFERDYRIVRLTDVWSLQLCGAFAAAQDTFGHRSVFDGHTLVIAPDPFDGATIPLTVPARRIPARRYADDDDLRATLARATPAPIERTIRG
ncbi:MAG: DUF3891 family protein [Acidimicrobiia bacterium]|nr:DUF3891 family protein [Acidimicrobiia bacterium]